MGRQFIYLNRGSVANKQSNFLQVDTKNIFSTSMTKDHIQQTFKVNILISINNLQFIKSQQH